MDICNFVETLTMVVKIVLRSKSHLVCSDMRDMTLDNLLLPQSWIFFCIASDLGISGFSSCIILIFGSSQLGEFVADVHDHKSGH